MTDDELLAGFDQDVEDDPDARIWLAAEADRDAYRYSVDVTAGYLPDAGHDPTEDNLAYEFYVDDDGEYIDSDPDSPLVSGGHMGELWLGEGDYVHNGGRRTRKPVPNDVPTVCGCDWPVPVSWSWSQCEFGGPRAWRSIHPEMEAVLDDDPLLYRVAPWIWTFCRCNGCVGLTRKKGRPARYCGKRCKADADNLRDRMRRRAAGAIPRNRNVTEFTAQSA